MKEDLHKIQLKTQAATDRQHVRVGKIVEDTINTEGWKSIIKPLLDKMIADVVGSKSQDGSWDPGSFGDKRLTETKAQNLLWYRQALIEFDNYVYDYIKLKNKAEFRLEEYRRGKKDVAIQHEKGPYEGYIPDTRYYQDEDGGINA